MNDVYSKDPPQPQIHSPLSSSLHTKQQLISHLQQTIPSPLSNKTPTHLPNKMDGDQSAKTMEQGANSAMKDDSMASGIHESVKQTVRPPSHSLLSQISLTHPAARNRRQNHRQRHILIFERWCRRQHVQC